MRQLMYNCVENMEPYGAILWSHFMYFFIAKIMWMAKLRKLNSLGMRPLL